MPVAIFLLLGAYAQTAFNILPMGYADPVARMTAVGIAPVTEQISELARENHARAIVTTKYVTTGWLLFYLHPRLPVIPVSEEYRWLSSPLAPAKALNGRLLYVTQNPRQELAAIAQHFYRVIPVATLNRTRSGVIIDHFYVYSLSGFHGTAVGRMP